MEMVMQPLCLVFVTIKNNGVLFQSCLDKLISEEVKAECRKRKWEEQQAEKATYASSLEQLWSVGRIRSGKLAMIGKFQLDSDVLTAMQEQEDDDLNKQLKKNKSDRMKLEKKDLLLYDASDNFKNN
jgi:hypothetical protein